MTAKLNIDEVNNALKDLNSCLSEDKKWILQDGKLTKSFTFRNFIRAFGWMTEVAIWAEKLKHHPEWFNVYNRVDVALTTHDAGGISELDFKLAAKMESLLA